MTSLSIFSPSRRNRNSALLSTKRKISHAEATLSKWISARVAHFIREPALLQKRPCWRVCRCRRGRSRRHDRSGSKRHYAREEGDDVATVENHVRGRSALAHMAVDHVVIVSRRASEISSAVTIQG